MTNCLPHLKRLSGLDIAFLLVFAAAVVFCFASALTAPSLGAGVFLAFCGVVFSAPLGLTCHRLRVTR